MTIAVKVPAVGESITEGQIAGWRIKSGDFVKLDDVLLDLETDKATVEVVCEAPGIITLKKQAGETVKVGEVIAEIDASASAPVVAATGASEKAGSSAKTPPASTPAAANAGATASEPASATRHGPAVSKMLTENKLDATDIPATGKDGRVTKGDVVAYMEGGKSLPAAAAVKSETAPGKAMATKAAVPAAVFNAERNERREPMTMLRKRIAERLVYAQENAAILTTFNEIDMTAVMALRNAHKEKFKEKYGINLGFMSFFVKAACEALQTYPRINGWIEGNDIVYHDYCDIGVAVSTERGLLVPVVRNAHLMSFAQIEKQIADYAVKARDNKISLDDLSGGTFTVSNGGVFGSLMSTPILNPPQSGILGMHKTQERPVVVNGEIKIRPMMYVALSYDHRIVDGRESVQFLVKIKESLEDPARLLLGI